MILLMRSRRKLPSDVTLPVTPMLDMSFQLLFFFICIYKPPATQEGQFLLDLKPPLIQSPSSSGSGSGSSSKPPDIFAPPIPYHLTLNVYTHINPDAKGMGDFLVERMTIEGLDNKAKNELQKAGVVKELNATIAQVLPAGGDAPERVSAESEKELLEQVPKILKEARTFTPPDVARVVKISAPREIRTHKIVKLMDYCHAAGFAIDLKVAR
jgi:biopolymer transport protein ExbD